MALESRNLSGHASLTFENAHKRLFSITQRVLTIGGEVSRGHQLDKFHDFENLTCVLSGQFSKLRIELQTQIYVVNAENRF